MNVDSHLLRIHGASWIDSEPGVRSLIDRLTDSIALEVTVSVCVFFDMVITLVSVIIYDNNEAEGIGLFIISSTVLVVLCFDVMLRMLKDRCSFFYKPLNCIELLVALLAFIAMTFEVTRRTGTSSAGAMNSNGGVSFARMLRPALRLFRISRVFLQVFFVRGGVKGTIERQTDRMFDKVVRKKLTQLLLVPFENILIKPSEGTFHLEKAQVRSSVFDGVHFPLTVVGGIIDLLHVHVDLPKFRRRRVDKDLADGEQSKDNGEEHKLKFIMENVILVIGPGHHQEPPAPPWAYDEVLRRKSQLVKLATSGLESLVKPKKKENKGKSYRRRQRRWLMNYVTQRVRQVIDEILGNGMLVNFTNVEIRFEDAASQLWGTHAALGGLRVGSLQLRARGATEHEVLNQDGNFRASGRWRPSIDPAGKDMFDISESPAQGTLMAGDSSDLLSSGPGPPAIGSPNLKGLSADKPGDRYETKAKAKRSLKHGIRGGVHVQRFCVYWNHLPSSLTAQQAGRYSEGLTEGQGGVCMEDWLKMHQRKQLLERWRLAACACVAKCSRKISAERLRLLRERVASHRYLVLPFNASVHGIYGRRAVQERATNEAFWSPALDVNVHVPRIIGSIDLEMSRSIMSFVDYLKRWRRDDTTYQWMPAPAHLAVHLTHGQPATVRWGYALRCVLHAIDNQHPWRSLAWLQLKRRSYVRSEYVEALSAEPPNKKAADILQVGMPLSEVILSIQEAAVQVVTRKLEEKRARAAQRRRRLEWLLPAAPDGTSQDSPSIWGSTTSCASSSRLYVSEMSEGQSVGSRKTDVDDTRGTKTKQDSPEDPAEVMVNIDPSLRPPMKSRRSWLVRTVSFSTLSAGIPRKIGGLLKFGMERNDSAIIEDDDVTNRKVPRKPPRPTQLHVRLDTATFNVLLMPEKRNDRNFGLHMRRRELVRVEYDGMAMAAASAAPVPVWLRLAPPVAIRRTAQSQSPEVFAAVEVSIDTMRGVLSGAPSDAPRLRRMFGPSKALQAEVNAAKRKLPNGVVPILDPVVRWRCVWSAAEAALPDAVVTESRVLNFACCVQPLEVRVVTPLLKSVLRTLKDPGKLRESPRDASKQQPSSRKGRASPAASPSNGIASGSIFDLTSFTRKPTTASGGLTSPKYGDSSMARKLPTLETPTSLANQLWNSTPLVMNYLVGGASPSSPSWGAASAGSGPSLQKMHEQMQPSAEDIRLFWEELRQLRKKYVEKRIIKKKIVKSEKHIGAKNPLTRELRGGKVQGHFFFMKGLEAISHETYSKGSWILKKVTLPPGIAEVEQGGVPAGVHASFRASAEAPGSRKGGVAVRAYDGWWFENEREARLVADAEAACVQMVLERSRLGKKTEADVTKSASAFSKDVLEEPLDDPLLGADDGPTNGSGGPRYMPNASAVGLPTPPAPTPTPKKASAWRKSRLSDRENATKALLDGPTPCGPGGMACCQVSQAGAVQIIKDVKSLRVKDDMESLLRGGGNATYDTARYGLFADRSNTQAELQIGLESCPAQDLGLPRPQDLKAWLDMLGLKWYRPDPET